MSVAGRAADTDTDKPTAAAPPKSWPNLGYERLSALDYLVPVYTREWFLDAASRVEALPFIADTLQRIADTPSAIKALNRYRPHTPDRILGLLRALHYLASGELTGEKRKPLLKIVADIWNVKDRTIEDDNGVHGARAQQILQWMIEDRSKLAAMDRSQVIAALDRDLKLKAAQEPKRKRIARPPEKGAPPHLEK